MQCTFCARVSRARCASNHVGLPLAVATAACACSRAPRVSRACTYAHAVAHACRTPGTDTDTMRGREGRVCVPCFIMCNTHYTRPRTGAARRVSGAADLDKSKIAVAEVSSRVPHPRRPVSESRAVLNLGAAVRAHTPPRAESLSRNLSLQIATKLHAGGCTYSWTEGCDSDL